MRTLKRNELTKSISMALMGSVVAATVVVPVYAQEDTAVLEEVLVTAQKREENLRKKKKRTKHVGICYPDYYHYWGIIVHSGVYQTWCSRKAKKCHR